MGEMYTIADPHLFTLAQWLEAEGGRHFALPRVIEHQSHMAERRNVIEAIAEELAE